MRMALHIHLTNIPHLIRIWSKSNDDGDVCRRMNEIKKKSPPAKNNNKRIYFEECSNQQQSTCHNTTKIRDLLTNFNTISHTHTIYKSNARGKLKNLKRSCDEYARNQHCSIAKNDTKLHYI